MVQHTDVCKSGTGTTTGAVSLELVGVPVEGVAGVIINATCLGIDRANKTQSVTYSTIGGGGIDVLGVITLLPNLSGGTQKSLSLLTANVTVALSTGFMRMTVTGVAGRTIDWVGKIELITQ